MNKMIVHTKLGAIEAKVLDDPYHPAIRVYVDDELICTVECADKIQAVVYSEHEDAPVHIERW